MIFLLSMILSSAELSHFEMERCERQLRITIWGERHGQPIESARAAKQIEATKKGKKLRLLYT